MPQDVLTWMPIVAAVMVCTLLVLWVIDRLAGGNGSSAVDDDSPQAPSFLFRNDTLVDADVDGASGTGWRQAQTWTDLRKTLAMRFTSLPEHLGPETASAVFKSHLGNDTAKLRVDADGEFVRVVLDDSTAYGAAQRHADLVQNANRGALVTAMRRAPCPTWETDHSGQVIWKNLALEKLIGDAPAIAKTMSNTHETGARIRVENGGKEFDRWFEITTQAGETGTIHYAKEVTQIVRAEAAQRNFVQTLTKIFANLSIGLVVFDRNRQLALFNPALMDLTGLPPDFLSSKPDILTFFDRLRDRRILPEPRNYASWRAQMQAVFDKASDGLYLDTWSLPGDITYRVTGRPHPDGAVAFLLEDISAEVSLNRRFRSQLNLREAVLDAQDHAVFVFSPMQSLTFCNDAAGDLMQLGPNEVVNETGCDAVLQRLQQGLGSSTDWDAVRTRLDQTDGDTAEPLTLVTGEGRICRATVQTIVEGYKLLTIDRLDAKFDAESNRRSA